jgi:hypothetical protein
MIPRRTPLTRRARVKPVNPTRKARAFARAYGSRERVRWVQSLPCVGCGGGPSDNAHTATGGTGYKADAETIAPLCRPCHQAYDQHRAPFDTALAREAVQLQAAVTAAQWDRMGDTA